jgi:hypothetical protein
MAMSKATLKAALYAAFQADVPGTSPTTKIMYGPAAISRIIDGTTYSETPTNQANRVAVEDAWCDRIADQIVTHIKNNAATSTTVSASVTGTAGPYPVVGTASQAGATGTVS